MAHEILDRPIAFQRAYVDLTGSIAAALMLSMVVQSLQKSGTGTLFKEFEDWEQETGMTMDDVEDAHRHLKRFPWWDMEHVHGGGYWYKVDLNGLWLDVIKGVAS